jgi:8'-apo-carotenoid 13,14-cleaving dioxygenase
MAGVVETLVRGAVMKIADFNRARAKLDGPNPFLTGINTPMPEELTLSDLAVTGSIPAELDGLYVRNGPNPITSPNPATHHWFMGDGMVNGLRIQDGKVLWYRNRWIRSTAVTDALGEPRAPGPHEPPFDLVNTNVLGHAGKIWALVEAGGSPVEIDQELNTVAYNRFDDTLKGASYAAHPHMDPKTGELHAICYSVENLREIRHVVVDTKGRVRREEPIAVQDGPSIHDCMITEKYVIILDLPLTFSLKAVLKGQGIPFVWNPKHKARVGLLAKEGKGEDTIWCDVDPCYVFHPCNAYDNPDGSVTLDVCVHNTVYTSSIIAPDATENPFERWTVDPASHRVTRKVIDASPQEFPRPNETRMGLPYRYAYTVAVSRDENPAHPEDSTLYKHDLETGTRQVRHMGKGQIAGEFVFVPAANSNAEDDGWLMGLVVDLVRDTTDFMILKASDFEGPPQAIVHIPHRIPPGFHGNWIPASGAD